ncbi:MAG: 4-hydroxythreonine-4-phosphate dehydrogenase PdxA [Proteobacteria bacterium]|nr:4-hydroxythreonine-4-phosphate dehydrogenase PdxA [Pseudomonadota bacterium]
MPDAQGQPIVAITSGEPAGIGPDIIAHIDANQFSARLVILGDRDLIESRARSQGVEIQFDSYQADQTSRQENAIEILHLPLASTCKPGVLCRDNATYVLEMLRRACNGCLNLEFDAMVTAPVQKEHINQAGIGFTGHTEFLAEICGVEKPVMLLTADNLRVALVTTHLSLRQVPDAIDADLIIRIVEILDHDLRQRFNIARPHIKVCGLNPHAGEGGYLGREEIEIIKPAIETLRRKGLNISGPYPADTVFTPMALADANAVLAMYHDQGLPVLKHAGFHRAVNTTLGLPIIRTSVDHGTALDLAGTHQANPGSLFAAIELAIYQFKCEISHA